MGDKTIKLYVSSVSGSSSVKKNQLFIEGILSSKNVKYEKIDISMDTDAREFMKKQILESGSKSKTIPPQLFADDEYLGDYDKFAEAIEEEQLEAFLKLPKQQTSESEGGKDD